MTMMNQKGLTHLVVFLAFVISASCEAKSAKSYVKLADHAADSMQIRQAVLFLDSALMLKPNYKKALFKRGELLYNKANYKEALKDFGKILDMNSMKWSSYINVAKTLIKLEYYEQAAEVLDKCIAKNPSYASSYMYKGDIEMQKGNCKTARVYYKKAHVLFPDLDGIFIRKARLYRNYNNSCLTLKYYNLAANRNPENIEYQFERAEFYLLGVGIRDSRIAFQNILLSDSNHVKATLGMGLGYVFAGNFEEALVYFEKAITMKPNSCTALYNRAFCKLQLKRDTLGIVGDLKVILKLDPKNNGALELLNLVENGVETSYSKRIVGVRNEVYFLTNYSPYGRGVGMNFNWFKGCQAGHNTQTYGETILNTWTTWNEE